MLLKSVRARYSRAIVAASMTAVAAFGGCAEEEAPPEGGGGSGAGVADGGGGNGLTTTSSVTSSVTSTTTVTTTTTASSNGGGGMGEGGSGGSGNADYPLETEPNGTFGTANLYDPETLGFTASISDSNDFDVFEVEVPIGSTMRVAVSDGMGGCPADATVTMQVFGPLDTEIAAATGLCPELDGNIDPDLTTINPGGTHFVRVTAMAPVSEYVLEIEVNPPVCGDGVTQLGEECDDGNMVNGDGCENTCDESPVCGDSDVQVTEQCDDGNMNAGDGCDASCQLEGNYCYEVELNNDDTDATSVAGCEGGAGTIDPVGDPDWYTVDVTVPGSSIRAEVVNVNGTGCPSGFNSMLTLYNGSVALVGSDDNDGNSDCSLINPLADPFATNLAAGTYYLKVNESGDDGTSQAYVLLVDVLAPGCGDGVMQVGEECDDANLANGDGCSSTCELEGNYCPEVEANNSIATANDISACSGAVGAISVVGDKDYFAVQVTVPGSSIRAETTDINGMGCPFDSVIRLFNPVGVQLVEDDQSGTGDCSLIDPVALVGARNLPVGTYYVQVEDWQNNETSPPYLLKVEVNPPACGDSLVQSGEECDDGNTVSGDGCDATCQLEGNFCSESEPNDFFAVATPLAGCVGGTGAINFVGDSDYYSFQVTIPGSSVRLEVVDTSGMGCPAGFNSFMRLYNNSMMQLGTDDNDGNVDCSLIAPQSDVFATNLAVGTYFVRVEENGNDATSAPYIVLATVAAPGCGDGVIQAGEQCDDNNTVDGDGCSSTCQLLSCGPTEVAITLDATDLPQDIIDNVPPALSTINVAQTGTVTQVAVRLNITHGWMSDTETSLIPPNAAELYLADNIGGSADNMVNTVFSSTASTSITTGTPPWTGVWQPQGSLATVVGTQASGAWSLKALDNLSSFSGVLTGYSLYLCVQP